MSQQENGTIRHVSILLALPEALNIACRAQEEDGYALERIVPYTAYEAIAVFNKIPDLQCECGWRGIANHHHDARLGRR